MHQPNFPRLTHNGLTFWRPDILNNEIGRVLVQTISHSNVALTCSNVSRVRVRLRSLPHTPLETLAMSAGIQNISAFRGAPKPHHIRRTKFCGLSHVEFQGLLSRGPALITRTTTDLRQQYRPPARHCGHVIRVPSPNPHVRAPLQQPRRKPSEIPFSTTVRPCDDKRCAREGVLNGASFGGGA